RTEKNSDTISVEIRGQTNLIKLTRPNSDSSLPEGEGPRTPKANRSAGIVTKSPRLGLGQRSPTKATIPSSEIQSLRREEKILLEKHKRLSLAKLYSAPAEKWKVACCEAIDKLYNILLESGRSIDRRDFIKSLQLSDQLLAQLDMPEAD
ncbi:hypothetical protein DI09_433p10, partial [Mitosporidium daphniae]